ncbi:MAG: hypothetical protein ACI87W_003679 [Halieaceae bacterium]|jgi:hypothetical protein
MDLLLRRSVTGGRDETLDEALSGKSIILGSDPNSDFQLPGLTGSLTVRSAGKGRLQLKSSAARLRQGNKTRRSLSLGPGEEAQLEQLSLTVFSAPPGFDAGLAVSGASPRTQLLDNSEIAPWSLRRASWILALGVLILLLLIPVLPSLFSEAQSLRWIPVMPSDRLWSSGPLSPVHAAAGLAQDCSGCHQKLFVMVEDQVCTQCHSAIQEHGDVEDFPGIGFAGERCATCHREHNEPPRLVLGDNAQCVACHASPQDWRAPGDDHPLPVQAFTASAHPEFRLSHWEPLGAGAALGWQLQRDRMGAGPVANQSGLKFSHAVHLDGDQVRSADGERALVCDNCHRAKGDGEHFEPVTMDGHCRSCHALNFDPFDPDIDLPHGNTRAAFEAMEAHFIREFTDPLLRAERSRQKPRRLPGKRFAAASCAGDGLHCGRAEAAREAAYQFADSGCVTCHDVQDTGSDAAIDRWFVQPVKLTTDWYSQSRFSHRKHRFLDGKRGDPGCLACHPANSSTVAADVLIPAQENCLDCHNAVWDNDIASCATCHRFHRPEGTLAVHARGIHAHEAAEQ